MSTAIIVLIVIAAILLILIVLAQNSKGGMGGSAFGGGGGSQIGVKKTSDLLEKLTWGFAIGILILSVGYNVMAKGDEDGTPEDEFFEDDSRNTQSTSGFEQPTPESSKEEAPDSAQ